MYRDYYAASLQLAVDDNVQYLELRSGFGKRYTLSANATKTGGQAVVDSSGVQDVQLLQQIVSDFVAAHPADFLAVVRFEDHEWREQRVGQRSLTSRCVLYVFRQRCIYQTSRSKGLDKVLQAMQDALRLRTQFPDFIVGFGE